MPQKLGAFFDFLAKSIFTLVISATFDTIFDWQKIIFWKKCSIRIVPLLLLDKPNRAVFENSSLLCVKNKVLSGFLSVFQIFDLVKNRVYK